MAPQADLRKTRDKRRVGQALNRSRITAEGTENTMPYIMEAVHAYATLGEIIQGDEGSVWRLRRANHDIRAIRCQIRKGVADGATPFYLPEK
jgi:methylmalonyl-CoA mutase N-terminal domain/subunit